MLHRGHRSGSPSSLSFLEDSWGFMTATLEPRLNYPMYNWFVYVDSKMREPPKRAAAFGSTSLTVPICSPVGWKHVLCVSGLAYKNQKRWLSCIWKITVWCFLASLTPRPFFPFLSLSHILKTEYSDTIESSFLGNKSTFGIHSYEGEKIHNWGKRKKGKMCKIFKNSCNTYRIKKVKMLYFFYFCFWHHCSIPDAHFHFYLFLLLDLFSLCLIFHWLHWTSLTAWSFCGPNWHIFVQILTNINCSCA